MTFSCRFGKLWRPVALMFLLSLWGGGCANEQGVAIQWKSRRQILMSEASQVKLRAAQSQVFDVTNRIEILRAAVATMQDLFFAIDVVDEELGIVSGKKWLNHNSAWADHASYYRYETDGLLIFNTNFRNWGPFMYRRDLARMTVTVRPKEETRTLVRASVQHNLRAVEDPETYRDFFRLLRRSLFVATEMN